MEESIPFLIRMSHTSMLSENQKKLLGLFSANESICANFYLTGGTALAEFYLHHRLSEDLDFFSEREFDPQSISVVLKKIQAEAGITSIEYQRSFNRNLFFLHIGTEIIKTEFTYFPFSRLDETRKIGNLSVDSLIDIATNKLFTIYQNPRSRDFIDLYMILGENPAITIPILMGNARIKFDNHIDRIQLGAQYMKAKELKDYPRMTEKIKESEWQEFFIGEARKLSGGIFK